MPDKQQDETAWAARLREATARLDAVGLPEPPAEPPPNIPKPPTPPPPPRPDRTPQPWSPTAIWEGRWESPAARPIPAAQHEAELRAARAQYSAELQASLENIADNFHRHRAQQAAAAGLPPPPGRTDEQRAATARSMDSIAAGSLRGYRGPVRPRWRNRPSTVPTLPGPGDLVVAAGVGVTGLPVVRYLAGTGAAVVVTSNRAAPAELAGISGDVTFAGDLQTPPDGTTLVVTSAGIPPTNPLLAAAITAGIEVIGEVELAWRLDVASGSPRPWLVVTGTNGKTTTTGMLESILRADGRTVTACGNIGWPVLEAVLAGTDRPGGDPELPWQDVIAVELSSFQLHWAPSIWPHAGVVLNVAEDHLDWHGSMAAYAAAKARALAGDIAFAVVDDPGAAALLRTSPARLAVPITAVRPNDGMLGVWRNVLVDRMFGEEALVHVDDVRPSGAHNITNALAAAGLALTVGVTAGAVQTGLRQFEPGGHRNVLVAERSGVRYFDDSKATNPHAARASLLAYPRVVWIAGGQLKGASANELVRAARDRLVGVVLLGVDAPIIARALSRHAPDVPVQVVRGKDDDVMRTVVSAAARMAAPGDVVLLAPAAASLDMYTSYAARGNAFAAAARAIPDLTNGPAAAAGEPS